ncbi:hypothetical protein [Natronomonas salsuginis]|uniref:Uncharacterized protein n=1 Tax=Natronomonas salsuginis TaxID=2217661 RepID=A0A4U5JAZ8_9EURY|nr:hypothetical protein [Natronomonas salsuginis]TKR25755.1 hypothetical protein DM868_10135 [Natronomonas salsuginis]
MSTASEIGKSVIGSVLLVIIFAYLWSYLPKEGIWGGLSWEIKAVVVFISGMLVIGPGKVALEMVTDSRW